MSIKEKTVFQCWQNFFLCVVLHMLLPLLPLMLEWWFSRRIEAKSAALTAALYAMAIGLSSRHAAMLGVGFLFGFVFSAVFGYLSTDPAPTLENAAFFSGAAIVFVFVVHIIERFYRHVGRKEEFFEFLKD